MSPPKKKRNPLIVILIVVGLAGACVPCTGVLAAVAIPAYINYVRRSKTTEARVHVGAIARGIVAAYEADLRLPAALPSTPALHGAERHAWPADADAGWSAIGFAPPPVYYSYEYAPDPDGSGFVVRALGDLDGDGVDSVFEMRGRVDPASGGIALDPIEVTNELE